MLSTAVLLVLCSGIMHAVWNLFTKKSLNKSVFLWSIHITGALLLLPYFIHELITKPLSMEALGFIATSVCFQGAYFIFLSKSYSYGDLSQIYPLMRGTGVMLVTLLSVFLFGESLPAMGWIGLLLIVGGLFAISGLLSSFLSKGSSRIQSGGGKPTALLFALVVGCCIAGYTLMDKQIIMHLSPLSTLELSNLSYVVFSSFTVLRSRQIRAEWQANWKTILVGSICSPGSYLLFLFAMTLSPLSSIAPIREVGTVFGTLLGVLLLKEQQGVRRIALSAVITLGIISVALSN
ncbi:hypothetical protein BVG16_03340 [Paenibacillus selenitireducens]|uniref:EamA domain-containing protein n=1 Tax=Paenibacillus selenitireducens TaxID=1324314 RepID=A0A1T2XNA9_9BACL|nr:SMR family transporter [Paenibacillus selenitireducens]OPA81359.1 hypothetical protein BVG16_03340 [Paenibacillus selenitireducens]